ncbi:MEMAR_RS02690 family S-layer glycoprotein [Methanofollis aquaemaris]|nr:MEMAR_RS02690 family S-layer glycoprotein [Methanofollis aquaemaris]
MKSTSKMMVFAAVFLVAAALLVMPASAEDRMIDVDDTFFANENPTDLNFSKVNAAVGGSMNRLVKYNEDDKSKGQKKSFRVSNDKITDELQGVDFADDIYGTYFVQNGTEVTDTKVYFEKPTLKITPVLASDKSSSVAGKTVTKDNKIFFKVDTGKVGSTYSAAATPNGYFNFEIKLIGKDGSEVVVIPHDGFNQELSGVDVTQQVLYVGNSTDYSGTVEANGLYLSDLTSQSYQIVASWTGPEGFDDYAKDSEAASFTISTVDLAIEANKENVVRNNDFTVTIRGAAKANYYLYIEKVSGLEPEQYPTLKPGQIGVTYSDSGLPAFDADMKFAYEGKDASALTTVNGKIDTGAPKTYALVKTSSGGLRTVGFTTSSDTKDRSFTFKVVDPDDATKDDDVKVKIEEGEVTITAEGAGTYYLGEEIKLSGTNTDSDNVYLFMTGPNLGKDNGVSLVDTSIDAYKADGKVERSVESDDTWEYRWDTSAIKGSVLESGTYTVYAVSAKGDLDNPVDKRNLKDVKYQTIGVYLKKPFLTLDDVASRVARGDELKVTGVAEGKPSDVHVWVFGKNYRMIDGTESVEDDGTFEFTLERDQTDELTTGQYFLVIQHPMTDGVFNVRPATAKEVADSDLDNPTDYVIRDATGGLIDLGKLPASEAATALIDALNSQNCDDTYAKVSFQVEDARIIIDAIGDQAIGTKFTITGTTNLAVGDELQVDVSGASFGPSEKTQASGFSGDSGQVTVEAGDDYNKWSYEVDAADFKADQYSVSVESVDADVSTSATFNVLEKVPTTPTTTTVTETVTTVETTTTAVETTTPAAPGFGALVALIGLGAVAFLVMRRD